MTAAAVSPEMSEQPTAMSSGPSGEESVWTDDSPRALWTVVEYAREIGCSTEVLQRLVRSRDASQVSAAFAARGGRHD